MKAIRGECKQAVQNKNLNFANNSDRASRRSRRKCDRKLGTAIGDLRSLIEKTEAVRTTMKTQSEF